MRFSTSALVFTLCAAISCSSVLADSTIDPTEKYAYAANLGWINFKHDQPSAPDGVVVGEYFLSGYAYGANFGWLDFGDGSPADGIRYQNSSATDCGVNHDGSGNLSGFAYGANIGWVNFGWATDTDPQRPRFDLGDGSFSGFAYGANIGWLNLGTGDLITSSLRCIDSDGDGISDAWELENFANTLKIADAESDTDGDGESDQREYIANTDPNDPASKFEVIDSLLFPDLDEISLDFTVSPGRLYRFDHSIDLDFWTEQLPRGPFLGTTASEDYTFPAGVRKFYRITILKPLQL